MRARLTLSWCLAGLALAALPLRAQDQAQRALDFERRGDMAGAAAAWRTILLEKAADLPALAGLERALGSQGRLPDMADLVGAALVRDSSPGILGIAIRVWTAARLADSARGAVLRWARLEPTSELPFQEWGMAAYTVKDFAVARAAYLLGRERLGRPDALAPELAQLALVSGDHVTAAREWSRAVASGGGSRAAALSLMSQAPPPARLALLVELAKAGPVGERLAAGLEARWGEPLAAVRRLEGSPEALEELLAELNRAPSGPETSRARASILEILANRAPPAERTRLRLEAAQSYAAAGDQVAARRLLGVLSREPGPGTGSADAASAIVAVLVEDGGIEEADRRFQSVLPRLSAEDRERLALHLAQGWLRAGRVGRADTLLAADSSVEALALRGKVALYRGDLAAARSLLREAGPFSGDRAGATQRIGVLGLLQVIESDSLPQLGEALLRLERRDSVEGALALERVAQALPPERGGAELLLLAGRVQHAMEKLTEAERLYRAAVAHGVPASSAAAEFALADLLMRSGHKTQAIAALEHLLLTWPTSAVVPQARRLLDVARGAVPSS
ncbi:MAG TPA: hypothetical protein VI383_12360 [Gemmatimonadales bacterium]|nr:hypothetical protein [Gemmatimonadales bacterium]